MALRETEIDCGKIRGIAAGNQDITVFKGIPYAEPPVGNNRWKPPIPKKKWQGIYDAVRFGNICPQILPGKDTFYYKEFFRMEVHEKQNEDCLQLNIWTPAESVNDRFPVLVFIHGGGFQTNYSFAPQFDGEGLAKRGIVVVTINYRLGIFGFLAHPELSKESERGISGNYGLMDQICALQWVKDNIHAFGGDAGKITISGGSAGAESVFLLTLSERMKGWFRGAVMQSGPLLEPLPTLTQIETDGEMFLDKLGISSIQEARTWTAEDLKNYTPDLDRGDKMFLKPCIDGYIINDNPLDSLKKGAAADISYMVGCTGNEAGSMRNRFRETPQSIAKKLKNCYGSYSKEYRSSVRYSTEEEVFQFQLKHGFTEDMYSYCLAWCEMQGRSGRMKPYMYRFERDLPGDDAGAFHASEHWYIFETLNRCWRRFTGSDYELSKRMADYWANFIKTGDPNAAHLPKWESYEPGTFRFMALDEACRMKDMGEDKAVYSRIKYYCS